jgi:predicted RNA binding protein YcfA (HicA-like mRNA interferase family)
MVCNNKDVRKYVRALEKLGWSIITGKRHPRLLHPSGKRWITISCTPHDKGYLRILKGTQRES